MHLLVSRSKVVSHRRWLKLKKWMPKIENWTSTSEHPFRRSVINFLAIADIVIGGALELYFVYETPNLNIGLLYNSICTALTTSKDLTFHLHLITNQGAWLMLSLLRVALWLTWVVDWKVLWLMWSVRLPKKVRFMPGGFAPRASAFTLGILLFVSQTLILEETSGGEDISKPSQWQSREGCFADHTTPVDKLEFFFTGPYYDTAEGCFKTVPGQLHNMWTSSPTFQKADILPSPPNNLVHPYRNGGLDTTRECQYMCTSQRAVEISEVIQKVGVIFTGAAVAIFVSDSLTAFFGWHLVTEDTSPTMLKNVLTGCMGGLSSHGFHGSALACTLQVHLCVLATTQLGIYVCGRACLHSVIYKMNYVIISAVIFASIQRWWSPMTLRSMVYTRKLWCEGEDEFVVLEKSEDGSYCPVRKKIDLYTWIHMHRVMRALHLLRYAMRVDTKPKVGTPVRCIHRCQEYCIEKEGKTWSTNGTMVTVKCQKKVTIPMGATGTLTYAKSNLIVRWDSPLDFETEMQENHMVENSEEWNTLADEFAEAAIAMQIVHGGGHKGELKRKLTTSLLTRRDGKESISTNRSHETSTELLWGIVEQDSSKYE